MKNEFPWLGDEKWLKSRDLDWLNNKQKHCLNFLCDVFKGYHHITGKIKECGSCSIQVSVHDGLSTFDCDSLTRLVILAHDYCVRVEIKSSSPRRIKLILTARERNGGIIEGGYPTIEDAIKLVRK